MYKLILFLLISLSSCSIVQQSPVMVETTQKVLLIDHIVNMYIEDMQLVKNQNDFTFLTGFYYTIVFERLKFNNMEKSYFIYVVEEQSEKLHYSFEY